MGTGEADSARPGGGKWVAGGGGLCLNGEMSTAGKSGGPSKEFVEMLRTGPSLDEVMLRPGVAGPVAGVRREFVVDVVREVLGRMRREILDGKAEWAEVGAADVIVERVTSAVRRELQG